ncbi:MAG: glycoside hydrolase family 43 protein [Lacisediminihabitans sp.]
MLEPIFRGYLADPQLIQVPEGYIIYGSPDPARRQRSFEALFSPDLAQWSSLGDVLIPPSAELGDDFWAPEVAFEDGRYWMYFSVGHGIAGHHIRVAVAQSPYGPFIDAGVNLTPHETFAIDAHPFRDGDGNWYLFFARDVVDEPRPGTQLAVMRLASMTVPMSTASTVLAPYADWQIYERSRAMYGEVYDWHTLEGPSVIAHDGSYTLFFSGGSWEGEGYGVGTAIAPTPLGPWAPGADCGPHVLSSRNTGLLGPGHCSVLMLRDGTALIAFHAWNKAMTKRQPYLSSLHWSRGTVALS